MKLNYDYSKTLCKKITHIQKELSELETLLKAVDDISNYDRHDIKAISKLKGWLMNLKGDIKRAGKRSDNNAE